MKQHEISPDLVEAVGWLKAAYTSYRVEAPTVKLYVDYLADLPPERVAATIRSWIANEPKFPSIADIRLTTIRRRMGAPPAYEAFNMVKAGAIRHDLVQLAYDTIGGKLEWERNPKYFPQNFIKLYDEIVDREVREFNEWSLNGFSDYGADRDVSDAAGIDAGGGGRGRNGLVLVGEAPGRPGDHRRASQGDHTVSTAPPYPVPSEGR